METMSRHKFNRITKQREFLETEIATCDARIEFGETYISKAKVAKYLLSEKMRNFDSRMKNIVIQETDGTTTNSW